MVAVAEPTARDVRMLAKCIIDGDVYSSLCMPAAHHRLALLIPPAMFSAADLDRLCIFAVYGLNPIATQPAPWGGEVDTWETCNIWPRVDFMVAVTIAKDLTNGRSAQ